MDRRGRGVASLPFAGLRYEIDLARRADVSGGIGRVRRRAPRRVLHAERFRKESLYHVPRFARNSLWAALRGSLRLLPAAAVAVWGAQAHENTPAA